MIMQLPAILSHIVYDEFPFLMAQGRNKEKWLAAYHKVTNGELK